MLSPRDLQVRLIVTTSSAVAVDDDKKKEEEEKRAAGDKGKKAKSGDKTQGVPAKAERYAHSASNASDDAGFIDCFTILKGRITKTMMVDLCVADDTQLLQHAFAVAGRTLTAAQYQLLLQALRRFPRPHAPIVSSILARRFVDWPSYTPMPIAAAEADDDDDDAFIDCASVTRLCCQMLGRLEERHGSHLFRAVLAYISLARFGVSETELFELLSLADDVLAEV